MKGNCSGVHNYFVLKIFIRSHQSTFKSKSNSYLEMMNHWNGMKIARNKLVCVHMYFISPQRVLGGVQNHFVER